jgi:hypothetical protein
MMVCLKVKLVPSTRHKCYEDQYCFQMYARLGIILKDNTLKRLSFFWSFWQANGFKCLILGCAGYTVYSVVGSIVANTYRNSQATPVAACSRIICSLGAMYVQ